MHVAQGPGVLKLLFKNFLPHEGKLFVGGRYQECIQTLPNLAAAAFREVQRKSELSIHVWSCTCVYEAVELKCKLQHARA